jgi:hypothetical protein
MGTNQNMPKGPSNVFSNDPTKQSTILLSQLLDWLHKNSNTFQLNKNSEITETKGVFRESGNYTKIKEWTENYNKNTITPLSQEVSFFCFQLRELLRGGCFRDISSLLSQFKESIYSN